ncbi:helix-turn-helix domain-containing protein [Anaeromyxobacter diazotrophicus]|jgi:excisionase family DNA binding protein|nr:helix-turn-helix domain-containing protein [Anaeromyxobacter diazotrophicus]
MGSKGAAVQSSQGDNENEPLWDARDVAGFLKVSRSWVYSHTEDGTLPSVRIGGLRRFIPAHIRSFARRESVPAS